MSGDPDQFTALWLRSNDMFAGETIAGVTCFCPDKSVTRGEFLAMMAKMTGLEPDDAEMTSGFADERAPPLSGCVPILSLPCGARNYLRR